jgi:hypothetical protein
MHLKIPGLSLGLSFKFFEYLSFEFEYFANLLQISKKDNLKLKKKNLFLEYVFEYQF